jgi:surfactin synthase thioesterase subunit
VASAWTPETLSKWLPFRSPEPGARARLFCLPHAGGSAAVYRNWRKRLPEIEFCPVELPGHGTRQRESPITRMAPLVEALADAVVPLLNRSYGLFGHSMGALVAFELALELRRRGVPAPKCMFVAACRAPHLWHGASPHSSLPTPALVDELRRIGGTPEELLADEDFLRSRLPIIRADFELIGTYSCSSDTPIDCPIIGFRGEDDYGVPWYELTAWRQRTHASWAFDILPGGHLLLQNCEQQLLARIASTLLESSAVRPT